MGRPFGRPFFIGQNMDNQVAYSVLTVKEVSDDQRIIRGMATTPDPDRVGDIVEPLGVQFKNPSPLLWMHMHDSPVGTVTFGKPSERGVPFEAKLPRVSEPSQLKARIDEAWESVKAGLIRAVSIGFRPLEYSVIEETGGIRFTRSEIYELSLVSVPANSGATISQIKSFDRKIRAAIGNGDETEKTPSGVTEKINKTVKLTPKEGKKNMSISEKLKAFKAERAEKANKLEALMEKSMESGETFDDAEKEEYETLEIEVKTLDEHIEKAEKLVAMKAKTATPVTEKAGQSEHAAKETRQSIIGVQLKQKLDPGIGFARLARCKALAKLNSVSVVDVARDCYGEDSHTFQVVKTAVAAGNTTNSTWANPLVGAESDVYADFVEYLRPQTILGRMGTNGIPGPRRVPFRTRLISQTSGGAGYWVGEGNAKPLTKFDFGDTTLEPLKVANIAVVTMELLRDSSPAAEAIVRDQLAAALAERLDIDFLDPEKTNDAGISPPSISNGVTPIPSTGTDADAVRCDIAALLTSYAAANNPPMSAVIIMSANMAIQLMAMRNGLSTGREFPDLTMNGGTIDGIPVLVSQYVSAFADTAGEYVFMVNASDIWIGDEGGISVDMSDQASLQMDNDPDDPTTASTVLVSLWQRNLVGFRAERTINWAKRRSTAVAVLDGVAWNGCAA